MEPILQQAIERVFSRLFEATATKLPDLHGTRYSMKFWVRNAQKKAYKIMSFFMSDAEEVSSRPDILGIYLEKNFEKLIRSMLDDVDIVHKLNGSFWARIKYAFTKNI